MKCPRCGTDSTVLEVKPGQHGTLRRTRRCTHDHKFTTLEAIRPPEGSVAFRAFMNVLRTIAQLFTPKEPKQWN